MAIAKISECKVYDSADGEVKDPSEDTKRALLADCTKSNTQISVKQIDGMGEVFIKIVISTK